MGWSRLILKCISIILHLIFKWLSIKFSAIGILLLLLLSAIVYSCSAAALQSFQQKKQVTFTATLVEPKPRWDMLLKSAMYKLRERHPHMNIQISYTVLPYDISRTKMLNSLVIEVLLIWSL